MAASTENPVYKVYIVSGSTKYEIGEAYTSLTITEHQKQIATNARIKMPNVEVSGKKLSKLIGVRDRVYIHANDGSRNEEVFRGFVWDILCRSSLDGDELDIKCYDNLIYLQESEDSVFIAEGKSTKDVMQTLCSKWGISLDYTYESITHSKLALRGAMSDIITSDILDLVKDRTGKKYVVLSIKDKIHVRPVAQNTTVYKLHSGKNAISVSTSQTMEGMTTKVVIIGKTDDNGRSPVEAEIKGQTDKYGTLQKIISRAENTSLADAKKEAQTIIDDEGTPRKEDEIDAPDIPWIREGDKVEVKAGDASGDRIVLGITRDISKKGAYMTLTVEGV